MVTNGKKLKVTYKKTLFIIIQIVSEKKNNRTNNIGIGYKNNLDSVSLTLFVTVGI